jgi:thioredoxin reductase (NADPH)
MRAALEKLRIAHDLSFSVEIVDVDADPGLEATYGELVPVLLDAMGDELCHYYLDEPKVREYLSAFR